MTNEDRVALIASADSWGEIGRDAAKKAQDAINDSHFGTAEAYRTSAEQAFGFELKLRQESLK